MSSARRAERNELLSGHTRRAGLRSRLVWKSVAIM
jgi:hypothetical protein